MKSIEFALFVWFMDLAFLFGLSQGLTEITVEFGQNVTLNCSLAAEEIFWIIQRQSGPPVSILRSFGRDDTTSTYNKQHKEFKNKYSVQTFARLFIQNVTRNELGSYYCSQKNVTFGNGITLVGNGNPSMDNDTSIHRQECEEDYFTPYFFPFVISCLLNCTLIIILLVGAKRYATLKKRNTCDEPRGQSDSPLYSEIVLSTPLPATPITNIDCTYSRLKLQDGPEPNSKDNV